MNEKPGKELSAPNQVTSWFTTPLSLRGFPRWLVFTLAIVGLIYLLNPTSGIFEFIPDVIPGLGNLDEGVALLLIWAGVLEYFEGSKYVSKKKPTSEKKGTPPDGKSDDQTAKTEEDVVEGSWEEAVKPEE